MGLSVAEGEVELDVSGGGGCHLFRHALQIPELWLTPLKRESGKWL